MLEPLLGSTSSERVLIFICARDEGYSSEIAKFFNTDFFPIYKQVRRLEAEGVLVGRPAGRTKLFRMNPRYPFRKELTSLLKKALSFYPPEAREKLLMNRRRPRRTGKPL